MTYLHSYFFQTFLVANSASALLCSSLTRRLKISQLQSITSYPGTYLAGPYSDDDLQRRVPRDSVRVQVQYNQYCMRATGSEHSLTVFQSSCTPVVVFQPFLLEPANHVQIRRTLFAAPTVTGGPDSGEQREQRESEPT